MDDINKNTDNTTEVLDIISNSSLHDFLKNEENCEDVDSIFDEISKLTSLSDDKYIAQDDNRTIEDILREAEVLINQPLGVESKNKFSSISCESTPLEIKNNLLDQYDYSTTLHDVSLIFIIALNLELKSYALDAALAITRTKAMDSSPAFIIWLAGSMKP